MRPKHVPAGYCPTTCLDFYGTAITAQNILPVVSEQAPASSNLLIYDNTITDARIGIHASNIPLIQVGGYKGSTPQPNTIHFNVGDGSALSDFHTGIWLQNCDHAEVKVNEVDNDNAVDNNPGWLRGIAADNSEDLNICGNTLTNMGIAMRFEGFCQAARLKNNYLNEYDTGIWFDMATFSQQGDAGMPWDNEWHHTDPSNHWKVDGTLQTGGGIDWYFRDPDLDPTKIYSPFPYDFAVLNANDNETGPAIDCETALLSNDDFNRDLVFGPVVGDSAEYENYQDESEYLASEALFCRLADDTALLVIESPADSSFIAFYQSSLEGNFGKFDSVRIALRNGDLETAADINENISTSESIDMESNTKSLNGLLIDVIFPGDNLASSDTAMLENIFDQHWITGGLAVYGAAAALFREYYPPEIEYRLAHLSSQYQWPSQIADDKICVFPNPVKNKLFISGLTGKSTRISLYDSHARLVALKVLTQARCELDLSAYSDGLYIMQINCNGRDPVKIKIALLK